MEAFRKMRRLPQQLPREETEKILRAGSSGVLAVLGDGGYPYAVPLSYVYYDGRLYFHGAKSGHKLDAVRREPKASFCVIGGDTVVPEEYTTYFCSAIAFGRVRVVTEEDEARRAIRALAEKYAPGGSEENRERAIAREWAAMCMFALEIEHLTGKQAIELARARQGK